EGGGGGLQLERDHFWLQRGGREVIRVSAWWVALDKFPRPGKYVPPDPKHLAERLNAADKLNRRDIPPASLGWAGNGKPWQTPAELVAILGDGRFRLPDRTRTGPVYSPDGKLLEVPVFNGVILFDASTGQYLGTLGGYDPGTLGGPPPEWLYIAFSADSHWLAATGRFVYPGFGRVEGLTGELAIWEVKSGNLVRTLRVSGGCAGMALSTKGELLASADGKGDVVVWDVKTGKPRHKLPRHDAGFVPFAFSPDDKFLATGGADGHVLLWDMEAGALKKQLRSGNKETRLEALVFRRDGKRLFASNYLPDAEAVT